MLLAPRVVPAVVVAVLGALGSACASAPREATRGAVRLAPGERAQGTATVEAGAPVVLRLRNGGPGRADFELRAGGVVLQQGALTEAESRIVPVARTSIVVVLRSTSDTGATIRIESEGQPAQFTWEWGR
jgi:hypothetical protein